MFNFLILFQASTRFFSLVIQEEELGNCLTPITESIVMALKIEFVQGGKPMKKLVCTHCGKIGHTIKKCYHLHGFPPGFKFTKDKNALAHTVSLNKEISLFPGLFVNQE